MQAGALGGSQVGPDRMNTKLFFQVGGHKISPPGLKFETPDLNHAIDPCFIQFELAVKFNGLANMAAFRPDI